MFEKLDTFVEFSVSSIKFLMFTSGPSFIVVFVFALIFYFKIQRRLSKLEPKVNKLVSFLEKR